MAIPLVVTSPPPFDFEGQREFNRQNAFEGIQVSFQFERCLVGEGQELTYEEVMERYAGLEHEIVLDCSDNEGAESPDQPVLTGRQQRRYAFIGHQRQHAVQKHNGIFFMFFIFFQIINIFRICSIR